MISKQDCIDHIAHRIYRSAEWRADLAIKHSNDTRNDRAAAKLKELAANARAIPDTKWQSLAPYFDPTNNRWLEAVSTTSRDVGFRSNPSSFDDYLDGLIKNLAKPTRH